MAFKSQEHFTHYLNN